MLTLRQSSKRKGAKRPKSFSLRLELLEPRMLLAAIPPLLDPLTVPKFVNELPNPLAPDFVYKPTSTDPVAHYDIGMYQIEQDLGLGLVGPDGQPVKTTVWGYGTSKADATYPGKTFVAQSNEPIEVQWSNNLVDESGNPLPHFLPIDTTVHWADPMNMGHTMPGMPYTGPVPVVPHLHGGHTESDSDGLPEAWFTPGPLGERYTGTDFKKDLYYYENTQEAATLWYHDHALGITRLNVYAGLAGFYIVRDGWDTGQPNNPAKLPSGPYEVPLVIQDRMFTADGQLYYPSAPPTATSPDPSVLPEFFGDTILVNGVAWPKLDVEPREYRFRILNGSDSRFYDLRLLNGAKPVPIKQIGTDGGLLPSPVPLGSLLIAPGERADVVIDFSKLAGKTIYMLNGAKTPFPNGATVNPLTTGQIMAFKVGKWKTPGIPLTKVPSTLRPPIAPLVQTGETRNLLLFEGMDEYGRMKPTLGTVAEGMMMWHDPVTENPNLGDVEIWEIYNSTPDAHPIHLHLTTFQVLSRQKFRATQDPMTGALTKIRLVNGPTSPAANEKGWKDTVIMYPGQVTRIIAKFDLPGKYVWHCHILSHEDHEMMRPFEVVAPASAITANLSDATGTTLATPGSDATPSAVQDAAISAVAAEAPKISAAAYLLTEQQSAYTLPKRRRLQSAVDAVLSRQLDGMLDPLSIKQLP